MSNEKKNVYYVNTKNSLIEVFTTNAKIAGKFEGEIKEYPTQTFQGFVGADIKHIHSDGSLLSLKELIDLGYTTLKSSEIYDEERNEVREKTQIEEYKENPNGEEFSKMYLKISSEGVEELASYSYQEMFEKNIITAGEYDAYIDTQREALYSETDKMNNRLLNDKDLIDTEKVELENAIAIKKALIKKENPKSSELL